MTRSSCSCWRWSPVVLLAALVSFGCVEKEPRQSKEVHDEHDPHAHDTELGYGPDAWEQLTTVHCEHGQQIVECASCRFEVGVVELAPAVLEEEGLVETAPVIHKALPRLMNLTGEVGFDERKLAHISPRIQGVVRRVFVELGQTVKAGARLVEIDSLELGRMRSEYLRARARLALTQETFAREEQLHARKISSGSDQQLARTALEEARAAMEEVAEQLRLLGFGPQELAQLVKADGARSGSLLLRSPIDGTVVTKHAVTGERLVPDRAMISVADLDSLWVWASVYERDLAAVITARQAGPLPATVKVAGFTDRRFTGDLDYIGATMDEATRTVRVRVVVQNRDRLLRPGMFAEVELELEGRGKLLLAPADAVITDEGQAFVFVKVGDRRFMRRDVQLAGHSADQVRIASGLRPGDEIVVKGAFLLKSDVLREKMGAGCAD